MSDPEGSCCFVDVDEDMVIHYSRPPCREFSTAPLTSSSSSVPAMVTSPWKDKAEQADDDYDEDDYDYDLLTTRCTTEFCSSSYHNGLITTGIVPSSSSNKKMEYTAHSAMEYLAQEHQHHRSNLLTFEKATQTTTTTSPPHVVSTTVNDTTTTTEDSFLTSFNRCSLLLGFLVGCFIQSSSLGANYILTIFFGHDRQVIADHRSNIYLFSLGWSFLTSMMGVLILFFLRSLLVVHTTTTTSQHNNTNNRSRSSKNNHTAALFVHLEYSFAFGALAGVCVAWTFTDLLLGLNVHAYHSMLTLIFAVIGKIVVEYTSCCGQEVDEEEQVEPLAEPLLLLDQEQEQQQVNPAAPTQVESESMHGEFKFKGICIGLLIGFFIQFSSLGASFLLDALYGGSSEHHNQDSSNSRLAISKKELLSFSLAWSFLFGTMGVMILLLLRELVLMVWQQQQQQQAKQQLATVVVGEWMERLCLDLEFYFAVGCLLGVNVAWVLTDLGLGFKAHIIRSLLTLVAAAVWCKVLAYCFAYNLSRNNNKKRKSSSSSSSSHEEDEEQEPFKPVVIV